MVDGGSQRALEGEVARSLCTAFMAKMCTPSELACAECSGPQVMRRWCLTTASKGLRKRLTCLLRRTP
eukprot:9377456-Alexandrium_andersonii.AAC.1